MDHEPDVPGDAAEAKSALGKIEAFLRELIGHKRRTPGDDLLAGLVAAHDGGDCLSEDELTSLAFLLLWAGYEVTVDLIGVSTSNSCAGRRCGRPCGSSRNACRNSWRNWCAWCPRHRSRSADSRANR